MTEAPKPYEQQGDTSFQPIGLEDERQINGTLVNKLGFVENDALQATRLLLVEALIDRSDESSDWMGVYQDEGQELASLDQSGRAAVGLIVQTGLIRYNTGGYDLALEDFRDAYNYALGMGFEDVLNELEELMRKAEAQEPSSEFLVNICRFVLSEEDCADLLNMTFEEGISHARTLLLESGEIEDPTTFFIERGLLE